MPKRKAKQTQPLNYTPAAAQAWMDITAGYARFALDRLQTDLVAQREMMACTSPAELMQKQMAYCQEAAQQYADQATRMVELMGKAMSASGPSPFARKYDDVPV